MDRVTEYQIKMIKFLTDNKIIKDYNLAVMAPTKNKNGSYNGFRVYANGGLLAEIKRTKTKYLADDGYKKDALEGAIEKYEDLSDTKRSGQNSIGLYESNLENYKKFIEDCVGVTKEWAGIKDEENELQPSAKDKSQPTHYERAKETEIIYLCREDSKKVAYIDMEFNMGPWKEENTIKKEYGKLINAYKKDDGKTIRDNNYSFYNRSGRVDLIIYDKDAGFGLIELKYDDKSMENIGKHFADFEAAINSKKRNKIVEELTERLKALQEVGICSSVTEPLKKELWYGFLLLGSDKKTYKEDFTPLSDNEKTNRTLKKNNNWICSEQKDKTKANVDWSKIRESYESGELDTARFVWVDHVSKVADNLVYSKMETYSDFIGSNKDSL